MLPLLTSGFVLGLLSGSYARYLPYCTLALWVLAAGGLTVAEARGWLTRWAGHTLLAAGLCGLLWWLVMGPRPYEAGHPPTADGAMTRVEGTVREPLRQFPGRASMVLADCFAKAGDGLLLPFDRIRMTWREPDGTFLPGDRVAVEGKLRLPSGFRNPGGFDYGDYLENRGVEAVLSVTGPGRMTRLSSPSWLSWWTPWRVIEEWRERLRLAAMRSLDGPAAGIYLGMILGQAGFVSQDARDAYMATGTVHILSISGSHLGLIAFLCFWGTKALCVRLPAAWLLALTRWLTPTRLAALVTALPVTFYTLLAGYEVATVRSWLMILLFLWAVWLGRANLILVTMCTAALALLIHDPGSLFDISFQLSFLSVLAIGCGLMLAERDEGIPPVGGWSWRHRLARWGSGYLWVSGAVTLATLPLVAYYFNQIAWLGLAANLVVVPVAGFVLVPLGLLSALWGLLVGADFLPAAALNQWACDAFGAMVSIIARVPGAEWHVASPSIPLMVGYYLLLGSFLWACRADRLFVRIALALLIVCQLGWWAWSPRWDHDPAAVRVAFLDVGQGDAAVIEMPEGDTIVIDGGAAYDSLDLGRAVVAPYLWDRGIRRVDHLIGTHPQLDHIGGLTTIVQKFSIGRYWSNGVARDEPFYRRFREAIDRSQAPESQARAGQALIESPTCRLAALNPPPSTMRVAGAPTQPASRSADGSELNNQSLVLRLSCGTHSVLFAADVEAAAMQRMVEEQGQALASEILKIPHHGARSSLHDEWIARVHPQEGIVSVGRHNAYGHPVPAVMDAYRKEGSRLWTTSGSGALWVTARLDGPLTMHDTVGSRTLVPIRLDHRVVEEEGRNLVRLWHRWIES